MERLLAAIRAGLVFLALAFLAAGWPAPAQVPPDDERQAEDAPDEETADEDTPDESGEAAEEAAQADEEAGEEFTAALQDNAVAQYDATLQSEDEFSWFGQIPWFFLGVAYLLSVFLLIVILHLLVPQIMESAGKALNQDFVKSFGFGALYLVGIPLAGILLFMTFIGIPLGLFVLAMFIFSLLFGHSIAAVAITYAINLRRHEPWSKVVLMFVSLGIFILLRSLTFTPFIGIFVSVIIVGATFGALLIPLFQKKDPVPA